MQAKSAYKIVHGSTQGLTDVEAFIATLNTRANDTPQMSPEHLPTKGEEGNGFADTAEVVSEQLTAAELNDAQFFDDDAELFVTRAPGRLDVMGGIADYSGSLVLQMPIAEATLVALQRSDNRTLTVISRFDADRQVSFTMPLSSLEHGGRPVGYESARASFQADKRYHWAAYVAGVFLVLMRERDVRFQQGAKLLIESRVPQGKGVSSSAAIEVAAMSAVAAAFDLELPAHELALLCQKVENEVVGAPCGVMDQMTAACGEVDQLLALRCQPADILGQISLPDDVRVWGLDSGVRHSVAGSDYVSVRTGAFMGYRMIADLAGLKILADELGAQTVIIDDRWHGYLANITPTTFEEEFTRHLPEQMTGAEFLEKFSGTIDAVTRVDAARTYAVRQPAAHAVYEHSRVRAFATLLQESPGERRRELSGDLMYQSHASYSACGLGSPETDLLVHLVRQAGPARGLYGARITGGGSGGTVAVLAGRDGERSIMEVAEAFERETKYKPAIFSGSSPGSATFGFLKLKREG